jgi:hypothetical protein
MKVELRGAADGRLHTLRKILSDESGQPASAERRLQQLGAELTPPPTPSGAVVEAAVAPVFHLLSQSKQREAHERFARLDRDLRIADWL